jgi:parallel beta-helix repeat protein
MEGRVFHRGFISAFALGTVLMAAMGGAGGADDAKTNGVVLIDQSRALAGNVTPGDNPGFPVTISQPGTYQLTSNLNVPGRSDGIKIAADDVTVDLGGFTIAALAGGGNGIVASDAGRTRLIIRNGTIAGFDTGVNLLGNPLVNITRLQVHSSALSGIVAGDNASITDSGINKNFTSGVRVGMNSLIAGNIVSMNSAAGIEAGDGSIISGNTVSRNSYGIYCGSSCTINRNAVGGNSLDGIYTGAASTINSNNSTDNVGNGIMCVAGSACSTADNVTLTSQTNNMGIITNCPSVIRGNFASKIAPLTPPGAAPCTMSENFPSEN